MATTQYIIDYAEQQRHAIFEIYFDAIMTINNFYYNDILVPAGYIPPKLEDQMTQARIEQHRISMTVEEFVEYYTTNYAKTPHELNYEFIISFFEEGMYNNPRVREGNYTERIIVELETLKPKTNTVIQSSSWKPKIRVTQEEKHSGHYKTPKIKVSRDVTVRATWRYRDMSTGTKQKLVDQTIVWLNSPTEIFYGKEPLPSGNTSFQSGTWSPQVSLSAPASNSTLGNIEIGDTRDLEQMCQTLTQSGIFNLFNIKHELDPETMNTVQNALGSIDKMSNSISDIANTIHSEKFEILMDTIGTLTGEENDGIKEKIGKQLNDIIDEAKLEQRFGTMILNGGSVFLFFSTGIYAIAHRDKKMGFVSLLFGAIALFLNREKIGSIFMDIWDKFKNFSWYEEGVSTAQLDDLDVKESSDFLVSALSLYTLSTFPGKKLANCIGDADKIYKAKDSLAALLKGVIEFVQSILEKAQKMIFDTSDFRFYKSANVDLEEFYSRTRSIVDQLDKDEFVVNAENFAELKDVIAMGTTLLQLSSKNPKHREYVHAVTRNLNLLEKTKVRFIGVSPSLEGMRMEPIGVMLMGGSGIGKTIATEHIIATLASYVLDTKTYKAYLQRPSDYYHIRAAENVFWEGFSSKVKFLVFDDFGQSIAVPGSGDSEEMNIIRAINNYPHIVHMAGIENKGKIYNRSEFVIGTTNLPSIHAQTIISHEALQRRFALCYKVAPKPEYCSDDTVGKDIFNRKFDYNKLPRGSEGEAKIVPENLEYHRYDPVADKYMEGAPLCYEEFIDVCKITYDVNKKRFRQMQFDLDARVDKEKVLTEAQMQFARMPYTVHPLYDEVDELERIYKNPNTDPILHIYKFRPPGSDYPEMNAKLALLEDELALLVNDEVVTYKENLLVYIMEESEQYLQDAFFEDSIDSWSLLLTLQGPRIARHLVSHAPILRYSSKLKTLLDKSLDCINRVIADMATFIHRMVSPLSNVITYFLSNYPYLEIFLHVIVGWTAGLTIGAGMAVGLSAIWNFFFPPPAWLQELENKRLKYATDHEIPDLNAEEIEYLVSKWHGKEQDPAFWAEVRKMIGEAQYAGEDGRLHGQKTKSKVKAASKQRVQELLNTQFGEPLDTNADDIAMNILKRNTWELYFAQNMDGDYARIGTCIGIVDRIVVMPNHFITQVFIMAADNKEILDLPVKIRKKPNPICVGGQERIFTIKELLEGYESTYGAPNDICFVQLPRKCQPFKDIRKFFIHEHGMPESKFFGCALYTLNDGNVVIHNGRASVNAENHIVSHDDGRAIFAVHKTFCYKIPTKSGDCGSLFVVHNSTKKEKIFGIHIAGNTSAGYGYAGLITQEMIQSTMEEYEKKTPLIIDEWIDAQVPEVVIGDGRFLHEYVTDNPVVSCDKTQITRSQMNNTWCEIKTAPAKLRRFRSSSGRTIDPWDVGIDNYCKGDIMIDDKNLEIATNAVFASLTALSEPHFRKPRILTVHEALFGTEDFPEKIQPINRSTSMGYPYNGVKKQPGWTKHEVMPFDSTGKPYVPKHVDDKIKDDIKKMKKGIRVKNIYTDNKKDERRKLQKVEEGKTRLYGGAPFHYTVEFRMYFGDFILWMTINNINNGSGVGINPFSLDWQRLWDRLAKFGTSKSGGDGDYAKFDGNQKSQIHWKILDGINKWYDDGDENALIRTMLWLEVVNSIHIMKDIVYQWSDSLPSGNPGTTIINVLYNMICFRMAFFHLVKYDVAHLQTYDEHIVSIFYGDDNIFAVSHYFRHLFTESYLRDYMVKLGMVYTSATKGETNDKLRDLSELTFLKRGFKFCEVFQRIVAPLDLETLLEIPCWTKIGSQSVQITIDNVDTTLRELSLHGEKVFKTYAPKISRALAEAHECSTRFTDYVGTKATVVNEVNMEFLDEYDGDCSGMHGITVIGKSAAK